MRWYKLLLTSKEKNQIADENFELIHHVAHGFKSTGLPHDELVGIGTVGFTKALNSYNKSDERGAKFSTYAVYCIRNEILHFLRKEKKYRDSVMLSGAPIYIDNEGNTFTLEDTFTDEEKDRNSLEDLVIFKEDLSIILDAIRELPEHEQEIIMHRYGICGKEILTQSKLGKKLGMTQANVSKIEWGVIEKLHTMLDGKIDLESDGFYVDYVSEKKKQVNVGE